MLDSELSAIDLYMAVGLVASIGALQNSAISGKASFAELRESTRLLPEKLVGLLEELRFGGYVRFEENANGNPYGLLMLTAEGRALVDGYGEDAVRFIDNAPRQYTVSSPERSTRRGGKREAVKQETAPPPR
jgi:hypothetical protein